MLEGLVAWVLNNYLGKYVENLNTDQLSIALLSGEVELENLPLKKDAFRHFNIPIEVQAGFIGKVKLQIPVRQIRTAPWVIVIERLYLVASPVNLNEWDNDVEENLIIEQKLNLLDALEAQWRAEHEEQFDSSYYATSYSSWLSYGTGLLTNIMENIQLRIKDVHLRYEDLITCGERNAFSCGLIVESLSAESCDANWQRGFTVSYNEFEGCSFKLVELQKLAFYWDSISIPVGIFSNYTFSELSARMAQSWLSKHDYVLMPSSAKACLKREKCEQPLRSKLRPRITCHLTLDEVTLNLTDKQYNEMVGCVRGLFLISKLKVFRQWRPRTPVLGDVRAWWKYAVKCHFPDHFWMDPKPTWETSLKQAHLILQYVSICSSLLAAPAITLSPDKKLIKDQVEWATSFAQLKTLREAAMRQVPKKSGNSPLKGNSRGKSGHSLLLRWFPQWWGWYGSSTQQGANTPTAESASSVNLEEEILDVLVDTEENNTILKRDTVFGQFDFTLIKGNLVLSTSTKDTTCNESGDDDMTTNDRLLKITPKHSLATISVLKYQVVWYLLFVMLVTEIALLCRMRNVYVSISRAMLDLQFENLCFGVESRPRTTSHMFSIALGTVCLHDYITLNTLFPVLIAPQGTIRENLGSVRSGFGSSSWNKSFQLNSSNLSQLNNSEPLFQLTYERKPVSASYRLYVKSRSLEVVYNSGMIKWLSDFISHPFSFNKGNGLVAPAPINGAYIHVKNTTKMHLMNQWEHLLQGDLVERSCWQIELDISAPQILLVEKFTDRNGVVALVDFGKMYLSNMDKTHLLVEAVNEDDFEMFMTPCSTPPGSEISESNLTSPPTSPLPPDSSNPNSLRTHLTTNRQSSLNQDSLHHKLYDRYKIELSDLQILVGRVKDNWKYAHTKGSSALHILDKFNILLQAERRVVYTGDPQFPSATLCGTLPYLVVHLSEHKLKAVNSLLAEIKTPASSPNSFYEDTLEVEWKITTPPEEPLSEQSDTEQTEKSSNQLSTLFMLQFSVDQMALEVQSRGRSIAELQVCGVKAACTMRPFDYNLSLSVHSLLLVDALQIYGADFELLVASHKHVGMDSVSGSMRDSEPTSPVSPASPDGRQAPLQPAIISNALHSLSASKIKATSTFAKLAQCTSPVFGHPSTTGLVDSEALIVVDVTVINANCPTNQGEEMRIANILFNNLDIIANQETIVELIGFTQRVFVPKPPLHKHPSSEVFKKVPTQSSGKIFLSPNDNNSYSIRTEITFDFHRLSVLLLRATVQDGNIVGKKIATATMCEAKIQATLADDSVEVKGSLGGLQVVSLFPGTVHQRILSIGHDLLLRPAYDQNMDLVTALSQDLYRGINLGIETNDDEKAFSFKITRISEQQMHRSIDSNQEDANELVKSSISVHMASVWYTHSGSFLGEVQSCVTEFQQYLSNLARSIKAAATDMAYGFVQPRESLYNNPRISSSTEGVSPRRPRTSSFGLSVDYDMSSIDCVKSLIHLSVDIDLESPVVVLPRSSTSTSVFVAHLGHMSVSNKITSGHYYDIQVRDINLYSMDIASRLSASNGLTTESMHSLYGAGPEAKPILHDTTMQLTIESADILNEINAQHETNIQIRGKIVTPLRVSATREQYEQLLDTVNTIGVTTTSSPVSTETQRTISDEVDDSTGIVTLNMDPQLRANFTAPPIITSDQFHKAVRFKVDFQLPQFTVELKGDFGNGERSLVDLSVRDFIINYDKCSKYETNILVSLHSITMEDLTRDVDSKHRLMMVSHTPHLPKAVFVSRSCPNFLYPNFPNSHYKTSRLCSANQAMFSPNSCSLPDYLDKVNARDAVNVDKLADKCGTTPPPSPQYKHRNSLIDSEAALPQENLVLISLQLRDPSHPNFKDKYNNVQKLSKIELNCLNLIVSVDSWVVVLDFFGIGSDSDDADTFEEPIQDVKEQYATLNTASLGNIETEVTVRSLSILLLDQKGEVCKANISRFAIKMWEDSAHLNRSIHGSLGSMSLTDLSRHGKIWRERFMTSGKEALNFHYKRLSSEEAAIAACDTTLSLEMSSIIYVHTKRFVAEIQAFFREFSQLQSVFIQARQKVSSTSISSQSNKLHLSIESASPLILVPVSSGSSSVLVIDLGLLKADNTFKVAGSRETVSTIKDIEDPARELLDVMVIQLEYMDLYCGERFNHRIKHTSEDILSLGSSAYVKKWGPSLLTKKCHLLLQVEKNMDNTHNVPDMTIHGTLNTLESAIDPDQYKLIKGLLSHNLGENIDDLYVDSHDPVSPSVALNTDEKVWTLTSIKLDLLNVILRLETKHKTSSLACINFIKSCLVVDTFSDLTQDIDLVSQEILVSDTRYQSHPVNKRSNVFTNIVQPIEETADMSGKHSVQAEVHARKRREHCAYTILVNNMRLMAIFDWWDSVKQFIMQAPTDSGFVNNESLTAEGVRGVREGATQAEKLPLNDQAQFELKLNITESQIVIVEDTSLLDSNTVILKSTTVISYRPGNELKPISCVLNHCEVFSCVIGMEDETALSIIDPVTVQIELNASNDLQFQVAVFNIRLSYHDMRMFAAMLKSLPEQARGTGNLTQKQPSDNTAAANSRAEISIMQPPANWTHATHRLSALGFGKVDCSKALVACGGRIDEAALWLTQYATPLLVSAQNVSSPPNSHNSASQRNELWPLKSIQLKAESISICVIDDCRDSDVPLLDLSLANLTLNQNLEERSHCDNLSISSLHSPPLHPSSPVFEIQTDKYVSPGSGGLNCLFSVDYYNRDLSGWEPVIEPWKCEASWEYALTSDLSKNRLQVEVKSIETLNVNITSMLMDLFSLVKTNWTQDYYSIPVRPEQSPKTSPMGYRRRSPFVPFALNNQTGCRLSFTTIVTAGDVLDSCDSSRLRDIDNKSTIWRSVPPDETIPLSFQELDGGRRGRRGGRSRGASLHQIAVRIDEWGIVGPVCIDRVGTFFRTAEHAKSQVEGRVVFEIKLEGSARKMITVRSALQVVNMLSEPVEVRANYFEATNIMKFPGPNGSCRSVQLKVGETWPVPLSHNPTPLWVRPVIISNASTSSAHQGVFYCTHPMDWRSAARQLLTDPPLTITNVCHSENQLFRFCCILKREKYPLERGLPQAGHTLILKPPLRIVNLLPVELHYNICSSLTGTILAGKTSPFHLVDIEKPVEISVTIDGFINTSLLTILPTVTTSFSVKVKLTDSKGRRLYLNAHVSKKPTDTTKVFISAPYWIVNRTGIPIIFKQEGIANEMAGQFENHEIARMVAPLLFSFAESDGSPTVVARAGSSIQGQSQWCSSFSLGADIVARRLVIKGTKGLGGGGSGERVFFVGIAVRAGRGRYRHTNICTISPRYQIHNNTSYNLQFAQKCFAATFADPAAAATQASAVAGSCLAWHWPRVDRDQLLCVRLLDVNGCRWSGGVRIDVDRSLNINCRDAVALCHFLRLEVVLQGATFFIVFTDAETMPPSIRIDNYCPISLKFHQSSSKDETMIKANSSMPWALLEPTGPHVLVVGAPGGSRVSVDLQKLGETQALVYQNFIYLAFTGTHQSSESAFESVENSQLVLEATQSGKVIVARRRHGDRAQLWRWARGARLIHEGSCAPLPSRAAASDDALVLDIEGAVLSGNGAPAPLVVRRTDYRRNATQTWRCTSDGRLRCQHATLAVQPKDGFFGLRPGSRAVLALTDYPSLRLLTSGVPIEQAISTLTLRPGSGNLNVTVLNDGPTRVMKIVDAEDQTEKWCEGVFDGTMTQPGSEVQIKVNIGGLGISLVSRSPLEELLYSEFHGILMEIGLSPRSRSINLSVQDFQCDNQLLGTTCPVVVYMTRSRGFGSSSASHSLPALQVSFELAPPPPQRRYRVTALRHAIISMRPAAVRLDERLLLAMCAWLNIGTAGESSTEELDEMEENAQRMLTEATAAHAQRYYFGVLKLVPSQIRLSMQTVTKLPASLAIIKKRLGLTLIKFEDAGVDLESFIRRHFFETSQFLWQAILKHFIDELKWQAAIILGSVDFLGNPVGFVQDVSDGVTGLIYEGNVAALVKNVTHGLSNSAAKVSESLGDGLGLVILDEAHEETRRKIRSGSEGGHLYAGLRGLYLGMLGGMTSIVKQSYEGASQEGLKGFLVGMGKGVVGTVTKPVVGVLDLAAETASAIRETSRRSDHWIPERMRPPRLVAGPGGLLLRYSRTHSHGQQYLYAINSDDRTETLIAYDTIRGTPYDIRALVSTRHVRIFTVTTGNPHIILETDISNLIACQAVTSRNEHYVELVTGAETVNMGNVNALGSLMSGASVRRPHVQCDTEELAVWLAYQVNYAKRMYHESLHTLPPDDDED